MWQRLYFKSNTDMRSDQTDAHCKASGIKTETKFRYSDLTIFSFFQLQHFWHWAVLMGPQRRYARIKIILAESCRQRRNSHRNAALNAFTLDGVGGGAYLGLSVTPSITKKNTSLPFLMANCRGFVFVTLRPKKDKKCTTYWRSRETAVEVK